MDCALLLTQSILHYLGLRWLLEKCRVYPNAFYNFLKQRKAKHRLEKTHILAQRYRRLQKNEGISSTAAHQFESADCSQIYEWRAVVRRKKPLYRKSSPHKIFPDLLQRDFTAESKNKKWATDFTYLYLADGSFHYNCTIIDLYDRSVVASITDMTSSCPYFERSFETAKR